MSTGVCAIIPAFNEASTVAAVVRELKSSPGIAEVIVVSDGSTDATAAEARAAGATVYELPTNQGKGAAMMEGVRHTTAPIVLFADADLKGLTSVHVERMLRPVVDGEMAMCVGLRDKGFLSGIAKHLPLVGGERALKREVIERIHERYLHRYMVETALNYHCRMKGWPYGGVFLKGLSIRRKMEKVGVWKGLVQYVTMWSQVLVAMATVRLAHKRGVFFKEFFHSSYS
jgi:glycosyltransferase involved in cell wall biosynthesis